MSLATDNTKKIVKALQKDLQNILFFIETSKNIDFYISSLTEYNPLYSTDEIKDWLRSLNDIQHFEVQQTPLTELRKWSFDQSTGNLVHDSGGFFSIRGLRVKTNMGAVSEWTQPIIHQPEIGVLGIITKRIDGILYFLMQAKAEPGNINTYQLSPTVQATRSNYLQVHGGKPTKYLEYFLDRSKAHVLIDQLQSEQGARFFHKRNRNIIVQIKDDENIEVGENFRWLTFGQIQRLLQENNTVNMDTRSVISAVDFEPEKVTSVQPVNESNLRNCLEDCPLVEKPISDFGVKQMISSHPNTNPHHTMDEVLQRISHYKFQCEIETELIPYHDVHGWVQTNNEISHEQKKYFSVIGVRVNSCNREVDSWDQPIIKQQDPGIVGFLSREIDGVVHYLAQLKMESGVMDLLEISPTVQCITDNYSLATLPPYVNSFLDRSETETIFDAYQSEEGGRFYQESNQNILLLANNNLPIEEASFYMWVTLGQLKHFNKFNNLINVEARSLMACIKMS